MSEPEVERLYLRREQWNQGVGEMLAGDVAADPFGTLPHKPHLFIAARPVGGWPEMCRDLVSGKDLLGNFKKMTGYLQLDESLRAARARVGGRPHDTILNSLSATGRTQRGAVLSTRMAPPSMEGAQPERVTDVEISEDGEIRFYRSAVGGYRPDSFHEVPDFWIEYTVLAVREVLALAREISTRYGHAAAWDLGMAVTGLHDTRPRTNSGLLDRPGYPGANYSKTTRANVLELEKTPGEVARRLVGGLYRIFNMEDRKYVAIFDDVQAT
jgi:hypothetical protein